MKSRGWGYLFGIIFNRVVPEWLFRFRRSEIFQFDPPDKADYPLGESSAGIQYRWVEDAERRAHLQKLTGNRIGEIEGHLAAGAIVDNELVGGVWLAQNTFLERELGYRMILPEPGYWLYSASIRKNLRCRGIYSGLLRFVLSETVPRPVWAAVNPFNRPSRAVHKRQGRVIGSVSALRLFPVTICWTTGRVERDRTLTWNAYLRPIQVVVQHPAEPIEDDFPEK